MKGHFLLAALVIYMVCCQQPMTPKPIGYFRIKLPETIYDMYHNEQCPYSFEINSSASILSKKGAPCWEDIQYKSIHSVIQLTYKPVLGNLDTLLRDAKEFAFKHGVRADGISEQLYVDDERRVYGILYEIHGNTATNYQFFVTDSLKHFLRGTAYVHSQPNIDSTGPVTHFLGREIRHIVETLHWK